MFKHEYLKKNLFRYQFLTGLINEYRIRDGPAVVHARYMGAEIAILQMMALRDYYPMNDDLRASVSALANFNCHLYPSIWFRA